MVLDPVKGRVGKDRVEVVLEWKCGRVPDPGVEAQRQGGLDLAGARVDPQHLGARRSDVPGQGAVPATEI